MPKLAYLKDRYEEEIKRFEHLENKSAKFLTFLSVIIVALTALSTTIKGSFISTNGVWGTINLILYCITFFLAFCSWGHALMCLKITDSTIAPRNTKALDYIIEKSEKEATEYIFKCYKDSIQKISKELDLKSENLEKSYQELTFAAKFFFLFIITSVIINLS